MPLGLTVFHVMSLSILNSERDLSEKYQAAMDKGWAPVRVALAVGRQYGQDQLAAFYTAIGTRIHIQQQGVERDVRQPQHGRRQHGRHLRPMRRQEDRAPPEPQHRLQRALRWCCGAAGGV